MTKTERLAIRVSKDTKNKVAKLAKEENRSMSNWIENAIIEKLGEKEMTYKLTAYEQGKLQETWATGTIDEVIEQFNKDKVKGLGWIAENDEKLYKKAIDEEVTTKEELEYVLDMINMSWWTLRLEEI